MDKTIAAGITIVGHQKPAMSPANPKGGANHEVPTSFRIVQQQQKPLPASSSTSTSLPKAAFHDSPAHKDDGVRVVTPEEYKEAAMCLAEAFAEDDVARYFIDVPDRKHWSEAEKWKLHVDILEYVTYAHCLKGLVTTVGEGYGGVALWYVTVFSSRTLTKFSSRLAFAA
jgi:hypothetical protein